MQSEDLSLWHEIQKGNESAYRDLFNRHYARLCGIAMRYVRNQDSAEDLVQDVFVKIWTQRESLNINKSVFAYLKRAVTNGCLNHLDKHKRIIPLDQQKHEQAAPEVLQDIDRKELVSIVKQCIDKLPEKRRQVFIMRRYQSMSYRDIAEELEISERTVEVHLRKARIFMRETLTPFLDHIIPILIIFFSYVRDYTFLMVILNTI